MVQEELDDPVTGTNGEVAIVFRPKGQRQDKEPILGSKVDTKVSSKRILTGVLDQQVPRSFGKELIVLNFLTEELYSFSVLTRTDDDDIGRLHHKDDGVMLLTV